MNEQNKVVCANLGELLLTRNERIVYADRQAQLEKDAARYRWLRDQDIHTQVGSFTPYAVEVIQGQTNKMLDGKELDEACDKAIAAQLAQSADKAEG